MRIIPISSPLARRAPRRHVPGHAAGNQRRALASAAGLLGRTSADRRGARARTGESWRPAGLARAARHTRRGPRAGSGARITADSGDRARPSRDISFTCCRDTASCADGEDIVVPRPLRVALDQIPVHYVRVGGPNHEASAEAPPADATAGTPIDTGELVVNVDRFDAGHVPWAAVLVLCPAEFRTFGGVDPEDPCDLDASQDAFADERRVDGCILRLCQLPAASGIVAVADRSRRPALAQPSGSRDLRRRDSRFGPPAGTVSGDAAGRSPLGHGAARRPICSHGNGWACRSRCSARNRFLTRSRAVSFSIAQPSCGRAVARTPARVPPCASGDGSDDEAALESPRVRDADQLAGTGGPVCRAPGSLSGTR